MALAIAVFLVSAVFADAAYWHYECQIAQTAADIAATAGASSLSRSADLSAAIAAATSATLSSRLSRGGENTVVRFSIRELHGRLARAHPVNFVEVAVARRVPEFFSNTDGPNYRIVNAQAEVPLSGTAARTRGAVRRSLKLDHGVRLGAGDGAARGGSVAVAQGGG